MLKLACGAGLLVVLFKLWCSSCYQLFSLRLQCQEQSKINLFGGIMCNTAFFLCWNAVLIGFCVIIKVDFGFSDRKDGL